LRDLFTPRHSAWESLQIALMLLRRAFQTTTRRTFTIQNRIQQRNMSQTPMEDAMREKVMNPSLPTSHSFQHSQET